MKSLTSAVAKTNSLGKRSFGIECEGCRVHDPQREGKFWVKSGIHAVLNFEPVRSEYSFPDGLKTSKVIEDIQVGEEQAPQLFAVPEDFQYLQ